MIKQTLPQAGEQIKVNRIDYIVISSFRLSDKGEKYQGHSWSDNISITAKRPKGKKLYSIVLYPGGLYSSAVRLP